MANPKIKKYTYYVRDPQTKVIGVLFALFSENIPTWAEINAFRQQVAAQQQKLVVPKPTHWSVEELLAMPVEPAGQRAAVDGLVN